MMCVGRVCGCERAQTPSLLQSEPGPASCTALLLGAAESRSCGEQGLRGAGAAESRGCAEQGLCRAGVAEAGTVARKAAGGRCGGGRPMPGKGAPRPGAGAAERGGSGSCRGLKEIRDCGVGT